MKTNFDLYTAETARLFLMKQGYTHFSYSLASIPKAGSPTMRLDKVKMADDLTVNKTINHRNGNITIITDKAYIQFIKL